MRLSRKVGDTVVSLLTGMRLIVVKVCDTQTFIHGYMVKAEGSGFTFFLEKRHTMADENGKK
jgi:hypothetical protein